MSQKDRIGGIERSITIMNANCGDNYDRTFANRVEGELRREIAALEKIPDPVPWVQLPPQPCPRPTVDEASCYRRGGERAVIEAGLQGKLCKGCEIRVSVLDGGKP